MAPVVKATLEDKTETPLVGRSRCAEAYVSLGMGSTLCYSDVGAADDAFVPRQRFSRGFLDLAAKAVIFHVKDMWNGDVRRRRHS